jgi:hypothetical protein
MPQPIAQLEEPGPVVRGQDRAVLVQVGQVRHPLGETRTVGSLHVGGGLVALQVPKVQAERDLLLVGEALTAQQEHGVPVHPGIDRRSIPAAERLADVDARHFSREVEVL